MALFAVGTDGFIIAGLLPQIAADLDVSVAVAGQLVTAFALAFAVSAPILGALTSGMDRRAALLLALAIFVVGNAATAVGPNYEVVIIARVVTAMGAGLIGAPRPRSHPSNGAAGRWPSSWAGSRWPSRSDCRRAR
ncbi:MFS transporter [Nonomuraea dietziae]|uniref:MFS transporter n=1 Tax=Nonomuraea dietziae TaxID=65515 RepID=UPI0031D9C06E